MEEERVGSCSNMLSIGCSCFLFPLARPGRSAGGLVWVEGGWGDEWRWDASLGLGAVRARGRRDRTLHAPIRPSSSRIHWGVG